MSQKVVKTCFEFQFDSMIMAIIPEQYGSKLYSRVLKTDGEVLIPYSPLEVIKKSCHLYASSFEGRKEGTKELIGVTHKPPIVIDPIQSIYFFRLHPRNNGIVCGFPTVMFWPIIMREV